MACQQKDWDAGQVIRYVQLEQHLHEQARRVD